MRHAEGLAGIGGEKRGLQRDIADAAADDAELRETFDVELPPRRVGGET